MRTKAKNFNTFLLRAAFLLLLAVTTTLTAGATQYIKDLMLIGGSESQVNSMKAQCQISGWTVIDQNLNEGTNGDQIFLVCKYETSNGANFSYIADLYISTASGTAPDSRTVGDRTFDLVPYIGDGHFMEKKGDLNSNAGGADIHIYYTKIPNSSNTFLSTISFTTTKGSGTGALGSNNNGWGTGYDLNSGAGGDYIYLHATTATATTYTVRLQTNEVGNLASYTSTYSSDNPECVAEKSAANNCQFYKEGTGIGFKLDPTYDGMLYNNGMVHNNSGNSYYFDKWNCGSGTYHTLSATTTTYTSQWIQGANLSKITGDYTAKDGDVLTGTLDTENHPVMISIADGATVTLSGVTINGVNNNDYGWAGINCLGDATIVLRDNNIVKGFNQHFPGIHIPAGKTLTIQGDGSLNVSSNGSSAGIGAGGYNNLHCGNIIIEGGNITATGGMYSAGIGGVKFRDCGSITITDGVIRVTATKGDRADNSIGAGVNDSGTCGTVTIGGVVTGNILKSPYTTYPYMVAFNANGGTGTMDNMRLMYNVPRNLTNNSFARTNYGFETWNTQADGSGTTYTNGQSVSTLASESGATITLYAQWYSSALTDGTAYRVLQDGSVSSATYTRTLGSDRVGKYQTWLVPFDYTVKAADTEKFQFYKINMIANAPNPGENTTTDQMWVFLTRLNAGAVLHANMPYVYKPKEAVTDYVFTSENVTLKAKNTDVIAKSETLEDVYSFYAIYENTKPAASNPFYYVNINGGLSLGNNGNVTVGPYRWIIRKTNKFGGTAAYAPAMQFFDGEETTGIMNVNDNDNDNESSWYSLDGMKLFEKPTQKGVYIHNGKKVVIK